MAVLLYFDTNVLCRPFDDQTTRRIRRETEAFERILEKIRAEEAAFFVSEILVFEIQRIISPPKRIKASAYLNLAKAYQDTTEETLAVANEIMKEFRLQPRDALHAASALLGDAAYFLSCDDGVTKRFQRKSLSVTVANENRTVEVMNPEQFVMRIGW